MSWSAKLSEPIKLRGERTSLRTLRQAANLLQRRYTSRRHEGLNEAIRRLMTAADDSTPENVAAATRQMLRFLSAEKLTDAPIDRRDIQVQMREELKRSGDL